MGELLFFVIIWLYDCDDFDSILKKKKKIYLFFFLSDLYLKWVLEQKSEFVKVIMRFGAQETQWKWTGQQKHTVV